MNDCDSGVGVGVLLVVSRQESSRVSCVWPACGVWCVVAWLLLVRIRYYCTDSKSIDFIYMFWGIFDITMSKIFLGST